MESRPLLLEAPAPSLASRAWRRRREPSKPRPPRPHGSRRRGAHRDQGRVHRQVRGRDRDDRPPRPGHLPPQGHERRGLRQGGGRRGRLRHLPASDAGAGGLRARRPARHLPPTEERPERRDPVALLRSIYDPLERGESEDFGPLFDALAEAVVLRLPVGEARGKQAVIGYFVHAAATLEFDLFVRPLEYFGRSGRPRASAALAGRRPRRCTGPTRPHTPR